MADNCPIPADDRFDVIMETKCPTTIRKCQWKVKDITKIPSEEIGSPLFETNKTDACEFSLRNFTCTDAAICPEVTVKYFSQEEGEVYITFKISFYDVSGEELYTIQRTAAFEPPKGRDFHVKDFPQKKVFNLQENTLVVECDMKISRPETILHKPLDERSPSPVTTTLEAQKSQSSVVSPREERKSQSSVVSPRGERKSQSSVVSPREERKSQSSVVSPREERKSQSSEVSPAEDPKSQPSKVSPAEDPKSQPWKVSPPEDLKSQASMVSPPRIEKTSHRYYNIQRAHEAFGGFIQDLKIQSEE